MSELRSVVAALRSESLADLPDARAEEDFLELHAAIEQLEAERLRRLADLGRRQVFAPDGFLSLGAWLMARCRLAPGSSQEQVRMARALGAMPRTVRELEDGEISLSGARMLAQAQVVDPEGFARSEATLLEAARNVSARDLQRVLAHWRRLAEQQRSGRDELHELRRLHASVTYEGMVRVDGDLDPETGETLLTALGAVLDAEVHSRTEEDTRSPAQRRADALGEICRQWLDRSDRPAVGGERPHIAVTVGLDALRTGSGVGELEHVGAMGIDTVLRLSCDASITRVVLSSDSEPLDVGRRTPVVPAAMRRALVLRDRHCRFPGCDRPPSWCDAHHIVPWSQGGPTSLENTILLCRRHHLIVHEHGGFTLELVQGRPVFGRPDGSVLQEGRGPP